MAFADGMCQCGCGQRTDVVTKTNPRLGWVIGRHKKFIQGHQWKKQGQRYTVTDRGYETPCWVWDSVGGTGYGTLTVNGKTANAHRVMYQIHKGEIPSGLEMDHLCRVRSCVNPDHLEPVTRSVNVRRGAKCRKELRSA